MKKLAVVFAICALFTGAFTKQVEARQAAHIHNINHRFDGGFQFGFDNRGFYLGYGPDYGYRNYGYRNCGYRGCGNVYRNWQYRYGAPYNYAPAAPYYYYGPRAYNYQFAPQYFHPYRGGRHWHY